MMLALMPTFAEPLEAADPLLAGGAQAVAHVADAELAQPRLDDVEVLVGRSVVPPDVGVHADRVAEGACGLRRYEGFCRLRSRAR